MRTNENFSSDKCDYGEAREIAHFYYAEMFVPCCPSFIPVSLYIYSFLSLIHPGFTVYIFIFIIVSKKSLCCFHITLFSCAFVFVVRFKLFILDDSKIFPNEYRYFLELPHSGRILASLKINIYIRCM